MIKGLIAPVLSPFNDDLSFCQELFDALCRELLASGCAGLAPFGTTGEALSLGCAERKAALEGIVKAGVDPARLIPGTGLCNLPESVDLCRHAVALGCAGVMTLPPFYYKGMDDEGFFTYFTRLIEGVNHPGLRICLYHIPQAAGVGLSIDLVTRLRAAYPDIIMGIKDSSGDWDNTSALLKIEGLSVYPGAEIPVIKAIKLGAPGCISATANLNAANISAVIAHCHAGRWQQAEAAHEDVKKTRLIFQDYAPIPAQKSLLALRTGDARWRNLRPPIRPVSAERAAELTRALAQFGMTF